MTKFSAESGLDSSRRRGAMRAGASILAVSALLAAAAPAAAQDDTATADEAPASDEAIVVTGIRASLANAQEIKRNADTVVDAITAQDIGALPDRSVTEALQRVPGISINRFAGTNDPDHFSVEGSGVVIRGLNFVRSEFNGRDAFSAGVGGQAINFADVPSELLGSVEVYKNATADLIEGGLAGTVNLNTRKPFDNRGFHVAFSAEANYGDFRKEWTPTASFLISNTWDTGIGTIGLLGSVSYSRIKSRADGIQVTNFQTRDNQQVRFQNGNGVLVCRNPLPGDSDTTTTPPGGSPCGTAETAGADGLADPLGVAYAPVGGQYRSQDFDRKRNGIALAAQWESLDGDTKLTAQFLRSHSTNAWGEHTFETAPDLSEYNTYPVGCRQNSNGPLYNGNGTTRAECPVGSFTNYQYDENGLFESGYITLPGTGWRSAGSGSADSFVPTGGMQQSLSRRQVYERNTIADYGLNLQHKFSDRVEMELDANWTDSSHDVDDMSTFGSTFADQELDITGSLPVLISHKPNTLNADWAAPNPDLVNATDEQYFADQRVQFWRAAMDHFEESDGQEFAFRGDLTYHFDDDSFIRKIKTGARYADRDQTIRYTTYNWGVLSEVWSGSAPVSLDQAGGDQAEFYTFPNFFRGQTPGPIGGYYYTGDLIDGYDDAAGFLTGINDIWHTENGAGGANDWERAQDRPLTVEGTHYLPSEIQRVKQRDFNAYVMLNFETPSDSGLRAAGNIGVRFVETRLATQGATLIPSQSDFGITDPYDVRCAPSIPAGAPPGTPARRPGGVCNGGAENYALLQQFAGTTGTVVPNSAKNNYRYLLPSLNLRFGVTDDLLFRLAISRVLTRPDTAYVRPYLTTGVDGNGQLTASVGNPYLKPATAWQFDATAEYYFSRVGSITANIFFKDVKNFFYQSTVDLPITNNGVTFPFATRGPANYDGHGKIKGFELAYQQTFDFLPGLLSGFGASANYSYIKSSGLPNSFLNTGSPVNTSTTPAGNLPLEGLSKHNVNATAFYEKGPVSIRVAYNWRSRFLLTAADVIFPYTSIFNDDTGQLDASIFFNITDNLKIGVQGVNLTNEVTKTLQAYTSDPKALVPRSYFMNDRRFSFILRGNF
ncbi:TonB-dependent receptor [Sphingopyxis indica]|uniref:TonB-dependent receptor n=1 Tax=Sphingopyxis indica TaxID=436663 RepID=A0A239JAA1_9SPHN|nr:TonB-dependent receptor [Sphingopyxis indica]